MKSVDNPAKFELARKGRRSGSNDLRYLAVLMILLVFPVASESQGPVTGEEYYVTQNCQKCHGDSGEGGIGPSIAATKLTLAEVLEQIRNPRGIMRAYGQDDLSDADVASIFDFLQSFAGKELAIQPTWRGTDLLNLPTSRLPERRVFEVHFSHRFERSIEDAGFEGLWGLDSFAFPSFWFQYGLHPKLATYFGRHSNFATWEFGAKVELLGEKKTGFFSAAAQVGGTYIDFDFTDNKNRFTLEIPLSFRIHDRFALMAIPIIATNTDELNLPEVDDYSTAIGFGSSFHITTSMSIDFEYIANVGGFKRQDAVDLWQIAWSKQMGGHLFQIVVTNSYYTTPDFMASGFVETGIDGDTRLGFNIVRLFQF